MVHQPWLLVVACGFVDVVGILIGGRLNTRKEKGLRHNLAENVESCSLESIH